VRFCLTFLPVLVLAGSLRAELTVVTTGALLADLAQQIVGDKVTVVNLIPENRDPHQYQPTARDVALASEADLVVANGLGYENYLDTFQDKQTLFLAGEWVTRKAVDQKQESHHHDHHCHEHAHHGAGVDPHWWHSISNTKKVASQLAERLATLDPENKKAYYSNAKTYSTRLDDLAKWARIQFAKVPSQHRYLVTSHDAFGYLADDFDLEVLPVKGYSPEQSPSSRDVAKLIELIQEHQVPAFFAESFENPKVLEKIGTETGARPGGVLYSEAPGSGQTYEEMMRQNIQTIVSALGTTPADSSLR